MALFVYGMHAIPVSQPTVWKHWRKFKKLLTPAIGLVLSFLYLYQYFWKEGCWSFHSN